MTGGRPVDEGVCLRVLRAVRLAFAGPASGQGRAKSSSARPVSGTAAFGGRKPGRRRSARRGQGGSRAAAGDRETCALSDSGRTMVPGWVSCQKSWLEEDLTMSDRAWHPAAAAPRGRRRPQPRLPLSRVQRRNICLRSMAHCAGIRPVNGPPPPPVTGIQFVPPGWLGTRHGTGQRGHAGGSRDSGPHRSGICQVLPG